MKKSVFILLLLLFGTNIYLYSQDLDEVLHNFYRVIGLEKYDQIKTQVIHGKIIIPQLGSEMPVLTRIKRPGKIRTEMALQGQTIIQAYNGESGWMIYPIDNPDPQDLAGPELENLIGRGDIDGPLYKWKEMGHSLEYLGVEKMNDSEVYKLKLTKTNEDIIFYYIDKKSYLILKQTTVAIVMGSHTESSILYSDYKKINGIIYPYRIDIEMMGYPAKMLIDTVEFNIELDDQLFERPKKIK